MCASSWLPPQYDAGPGKPRFPVLYDLAGLSGSGLAHTNWKASGDNVPERAAQLIREQKMGPALFVFPDCFTALGGNQYVNSSAIGDYADYLTRQIVPFVDREFRTLASREHRGCFGKSSGGYGSIIRSGRESGKSDQSPSSLLKRRAVPIRVRPCLRRASSPDLSPDTR